MKGQQTIQHRPDRLYYVMLQDVGTINPGVLKQSPCFNVDIKKVVTFKTKKQTTDPCKTENCADHWMKSLFKYSMDDAHCWPNKTATLPVTTFFMIFFLFV